MAKRSHESAPPKIRKWLVRLSLFVVVAAGGWYFFEAYVLRIDRYRPMVIDELERATGLPVSIARLNLTLFPKPHVTVSRIKIGDNNFRGELNQARINLDPRALVVQKVDVRQLRLDGLVLHLPDSYEDTSEKWDTLKGHVEAYLAEEASRFTVLVARITAQNSEVFQGKAEKPFLAVSVDVRDPLSESIRLSVAATYINGKYETQAEATLVLTLSEPERAISGISGTGTFENLRLASLVDGDGVPELVARGRFEVDGVNAQDLGLKIEGHVDSEEEPVLAGEVSCQLWWKDERLTFNDLLWTAEGIELAADITWSKDGDLALEVRQTTMDGAALNALFPAFDSGELRFAASQDAKLEVRDLLFGITESSGLRLVHGQVEFHGLQASTSEGRDSIRDVKGRFEIEEGRIHIHELAAESIRITGDVIPDFKNKSFVVELAGSASVNRTLLAPFVSLDDVISVNGQLEVDRLSGTFVADQGIPDDLVVEARLRDGRAEFNVGERVILLESLIADVSSDSEGAQSNVWARVAEFGGMNATGRYVFDDHTWEGSASVDLRAIVDGFLDSEEDEVRLASILNQYGESTFEVTARLPSPDSTDIQIELRRVGYPRLAGSVAFVKGDDGRALGAIDATATFKADLLDEKILGHAKALGEGRAVLKRDPRAQSFAFDVDLTEASVRLGDTVQKKMGEVLGLHLTGSATADAWVLSRIDVELADARIPLQYRDERVYADDLDVELAELLPLLPEGARATGSVGGRLAFSPFDAQLSFDKAGFTLEQDGVLDTVTGKIEIRDGFIVTDALRVDGVRTRATLTAAVENTQWRGRFAGESLDLNTVLATYDTVMTIVDSVMPDSPESEAGPTGTWDLDVLVESLYYRRGRVENLKTHMRSDETGTHFTGLSFTPYTGSVTGTVDIMTGLGPQRFLHVDLGFDQVDARFLDEMAFDEAQDFYGSVDGHVTFRSPYGHERGIMNGMTGTITWVAREGSFGKLGMVTKLLTVLRATDIVNRRLPSLRDKGLIYDECTGTLDIKQGLMTFQGVRLHASTYTMDAKGTMDFPNEKTKGSVFVGVLGAINDALGKIPLVRQISELTTENMGIKVIVSGSPSDPSFRVAPVLSVLHTPIEALKGVKDLLKDTVLKIFTDPQKEDEEGESAQP